MGFWSKLFGKRVVVTPKVTATQSPQSSVTYDQGLLIAEGMRTLFTMFGHMPAPVISHLSNTNSMLPFLDANALVLIEKCSYEDLTVGDIVSARVNGINVLHQIFEKSGDNFWTCGIYNGRMDDYSVTPDNFLGRVCGVVYTKHTSTSRT